MDNKRTIIAVIFCAVFFCQSAIAQQQTRMERAVISNSGGKTSNASTNMHYTVGETAVGRASNGTTNGQFGFWNTQNAAASVKTEGEGAIRSLSVFPNPASGRSEINLTLTQAGNLDLLVYDVAGHLISTLFSGRKSPGTHRIPFDARSLAEGTYFVAARMPNALLQARLNVIR